MVERRIEAVLLDLNGVLATWTAGRGMEPNEVVVETVHRLRDDGYRTALVTNAFAGRGDGWSGWSALDLFDVVVDSSTAGLAKPDPAVFAHALVRLGGDVPVEPGRAVFLDDTPRNVAGAVRAGLHGLVVDDPCEAMGALDAFLAELDG